MHNFKIGQIYKSHLMVRVLFRIVAVQEHSITWEFLGKSTPNTCPKSLINEAEYSLFKDTYKYDDKQII